MTRLLALATALVSASLAFAACSSSNEAKDGSSPSAEDAGSVDSGTTTSSSGSSGRELPDTGPGDETCSTLAQAGAAVDIISTKSPQPDATGGTPSDATYVLTAVRAFTTLFPEGYTVQTFGAYTLVVGGGAKTFEQVVTNKDGNISRAKGALVADGTSFTATPSCQTPLVDGGVTVLEGKYSVDGATLKMYVVRDFGITAELTFEPKK